MKKEQSKFFALKTSMLIFLVPPNPPICYTNSILTNGVETNDKKL